MTVKSSVSLSDDQHSFARNLVEQGRFTSLSAVLQLGVELLRQEIADESLDRAALAELLVERAAQRIVDMRKMADQLATHPNRGTRRDGIRLGVSSVTFGRTIYWFEIDEAAQKVRILAFFRWSRPCAPFAGAATWLMICFLRSLLSRVEFHGFGGAGGFGAEF